MLAHEMEVLAHEMATLEAGVGVGNHQQDLLMLSMDERGPAARSRPTSAGPGMGGGSGCRDGGPGAAMQSERPWFAGDACSVSTVSPYLS